MFWKFKMTQNLIKGLLIICLFVAISGVADVSAGSQNYAGEPTLKVGVRLPDASLTGSKGTAVRLTDTVGRVRLISVVPQLNTPVCDEQTHHFSEQNGGLDRMVDIVTVSTNTADDQSQFAAKADIRNVTFLSDAPELAFGRATGLLLPMHRILHRAVIVADRENIIRYFELVPMGQLPNFDGAFEAARKLAASH